MRLKATDHILAVWAEEAKGPGWANSPIWVLVRDRTGLLQAKCLQPEEHTIGMSFLFKISADINEAMVEQAKLIQKRIARKEEENE